MLNSKVLTERIDKWLSPIYWTSSNIRSALYGDIAQPLAVYVYQPENRDKPSIQEALSRFVDIRRSTEALVKVHDSFGPSWTTKWFQIIFQIPSSMKGRCTAFRWNSSSEAMLYSSAGICLQSFTGGDGSNCRDLYILPSSDVNEQGELVFYVEMVCNDLFGNGNNGMIFPPDDNKYYSISKAELVVVNRPAHALFWDVKVMLDMVTELKMESPEAARALGLLTQVINTTDVTNEASIDAAHDLISRTFFNSVDDCKVPHDVYALGHCHIDTAWLWSYAETRRKVLRSWSTQLRLLNDYRFQFVASQTVHFEWLKEDNLALYDRVKESIRLRRFLPVGGSYVEFDANMPSGESMIRQLLYGMRFTEQEFKVRPKVFWLPDTFGYSAQLPQILKSFDIPYFLSQKLSWNLYNKFPHTSFVWEGIDGSSVIAHFPSADTYGAECTVAEMLKSVSNNKSKMASNRSLLLFGIGDGGGGPHVSHLEQLDRLQRCRSLPRIDAESTPEQFFDNIKSDFCRDRGQGYPPPAQWVGELYLELHQGSLTSQALVKKQNRQCENELRGVDALLAYCWIVWKTQEGEENYEWLKTLSVASRAMWKDVLLNQFHDVLPGTSIADVYVDSNKMLSNVLLWCETVSQAAIPFIARNCFSSIDQLSCIRVAKKSRLSDVSVTFNPSGVPYGDISPFGLCYQYTSPLGHGKIHYDIIFSKDNRVEYYSVDNGVLLAFISITGEILMLRDLRIEPPRDIIKRGESGNRLIIYDDIPFYWDAWDIMPYYAMTGRSVNGAKTGSADINLFTHRVDISHLPDKLVLVFGYNAFESEWSKSIESFDTGSPYKLSYELKCTILSNDPLIEFDLTCDWHESHKLLKVDFPLNVRAATAKYDMQYGFVERPTHRNQDTDAAMFEVCGHKYADLSEVDYGVALINNCKYGYSALDSTLSLSLLRSPKSPDPLCDMGRHHMRYAILPHGTTGSGGGLCDVVAAATRFNSSLKNVGVEPYLVDGPSHLTLLNNSLVTVSAFNGLRASTLILDTIKVTESFIDALTEDWRDATGPNNTIVLRFYESVGSKGRATVTTTCGLKFQAVCLCDSFEDIQRETSNKESVLCEITEDCFQINYTSFQIITIAVTFLLK